VIFGRANFSCLGIALVTTSGGKMQANLTTLRTPLKLSQ
jgi:hypothetical protein